jgi:hypothetical protein
LAHDAPELARLPLNQWEPALRAMAQREPQRFAQVMGRIQTVGQLQTLHEQNKAERTARETSDFQTWAKAEDTKFASAVKGERNLPAIQGEIIEMVKAHGVDPKEFFKAGSESRVLRSAAAQQIMVDAAKYRLMQKAAKAQPTRALPPVSRPGVAAPRTNPASANIAALTKRLNQTGDIKDAVALRMAQRSKGR